MTDLLIRDLDPGTHRELKRRAALAGESLQTYVGQLLSAHAARQGRSVWFEELDRLEPVPDASGTEAVTAARDDLP